jgi:hypothetical protein
MKNDRIKSDRIKSDRIKNGRIKSDRIKTDRIKSITDPYVHLGVECESMFMLHYGCCKFKRFTLV